MYKALYRKWRPQTFRNVVGQEAITGALISQVEAGRVGHAYLFTGTRGTGKTTCAKVLAKAVNCEYPSENGPCGECPCCVGIENGSILDVIEIDAASNNGVDDVRDLRDETVYRPGRCRYKVYIIDEVHMLSTAAFNALLKILEEPPSHVIFILATTEIHKVPATILSRCQRFDFTRIPADQIKGRLLEVAGQENIGLTDGAAALVAVLADGSMRDALSLLDTCSGFGEEVDEALVRRMAGVTDKSYLFSLSRAAGQGEVHTLLGLVASLREKSVDVKRLTEELVAHYRNFLLALAKPDGSLLDYLPSEERDQYLAEAPNVGEGSYIRALHRLAEALDRMGRSHEPRVELELALFDMAQGQVRGIPEPTPLPQAAARAFALPPVNSAIKDKPAPSPAKQAVLEPLREPVQRALPEDLLPIAPVEKTPPAPREPAPTQATEPEDETEPFQRWDEVIEHTSRLDPMVYSYIKTTHAYLCGSRMLIDGGEIFMEFIRSNKNVGEIIKSAIQQVTGMRYGIGPYQRENKSGTPAETTKRTLAEWEEKGIVIEYENEAELVK